MPALNQPGKLAVYYGWPSAVNGSGGMVDKAASVFKAYDLVVFGDTLQLPQYDPNDPNRNNANYDKACTQNSHPDHDKTGTIIDALKRPPNRTSVYGYIAIGGENTARVCPAVSPLPMPLTDQQIAGFIDAWKAMGVAGIFLDEAGYDYGTSRQRQNYAIDYSHSNGLSVFINAWEPDDVFRAAAVGRVTYSDGLRRGQQSTIEMNPEIGGTGLGETSHLGPNDIYLHESYQITQGNFQDPVHWARKSDKALTYKAQYGTRMATLTTAAAQNAQFDQLKFDYACWSTLLYGFDFMGWGEQDFSGNASLPYRQRPNWGYLGNDLGSPVIHSSSTSSGQPLDLHRRVTPGGTIDVDSTHHIGKLSTAAYWRFEEGAGTTAMDSASRGNHGRISGATFIAPSPTLPRVNSRYALLFNAKGDYVTIPAGPSSNLYSFPEGITIEAFINPKQLPIPADASEKRIKYILWADDDVYSLRLVSDASGNTMLIGVVNAINGNIGPCTLSASALFPRNLAGVFSHVALTYGARILKLYVNGTLLKQVTAPAACSTQVGPVGNRRILRIGSDETAEMRYHDRDFRGIIDEVRISRRPLAPTEFLPR